MTRKALVAMQSVDGGASAALSLVQEPEHFIKQVFGQVIIQYSPSYVECFLWFAHC